jgi:hypothetical protein
MTAKATRVSVDMFLLSTGGLADPLIGGAL